MIGKKPPARMRLGRPRLLRGTTVGVVGTGQIGGSLVKDLSRFRREIGLVAFDRDAALAERIRPFARACGTLRELVRESDVVILAVPVPAALRMLPRIARCASERASRRKLIVCDMSTVKAAVVAGAARHEEAFDFVGLHPIAGTEGQGWESASARLFDGRVVIVCPAGLRAGRVARELVSLVGGVATPMAPDEHDRLAAEGIGLPHILAFAAAGLPSRVKRPHLLQGGSWRSLTRVAASNAAMVAGFLHGNRDNQLRVLAQFSRQIDEVARVLRGPTTSGLERRLRAWQSNRD